VALDERLRRELEEAGRPADPSGVYEELIRRRERRRISRRVGTGVLALAVLAGTVAGVIGLSKLFRASDDQRVVPLAPVQPTPAANGLVAFTSNGGIEVQAADGSKGHDLPAPAPGLAWHIAWSPDGRQLAVAVFGDPERSLWVMRADGSNPSKIAEGENVSRPSWHPDGVHLVYTLEHDGLTEVHVARSDGTDDRVVYSEEAPGTYAVFSATFSPDGSRILFDAGTDSGYDILVMDADGSNVRQLTHTGSDYNPSWSPDGSRILFTRQEAASESDIFVMNADGTGVHRLTDDDGTFTNLNPQFSPDGSLITYEASKNGGTGPIMVMEPDGSDVRELVSGGVLGFSWQPVPVREATSPAPTSGEDIGLGFPVCNVSSIDGHFVTPQETATVLVATKANDAGGCPAPEDAFNVVALDVDRDGVADTSLGPIECTLECRAFATPDLDGDGTDEVLVVQDGGAVVGLRLYDVVGTDGEPSIVPVDVADPGDPQGGFEPGKQASFLLGGDAFELYALRCGDVPEPDGPGIVATGAEARPHDSPNADWHAHQTTLVLSDDGRLHVVDARDFTEPVTDDPSGPSFQSGETLCGSNLGPAVPIP
jgi:Lipoprotein LpqB beta-propeller domain